MGGKENGGSKRKNKSKSTQTHRDIVESTSAGETPSQEQVNKNQDTSVAQKLDALLAVVKDMEKKMNDMDDRLQKLEERASTHDVSVVPSAKRSPKQQKEEVTSREQEVVLWSQYHEGIGN